MFELPCEPFELIGFARVIELRFGSGHKIGDKPRGPHLHDGIEECIYVLKGTGLTISESGEIPVGPGDIGLIPPNEKHMTRNTGSEPLVLLCFFPAPDVGACTTEFAAC